MPLTEDIADELAIEAIAVALKTKDDRLVDAVANVIGASSQTMEEAFLTAVRVRRAETRAREMLAEISAGKSRDTSKDGQ